MPPGAIQIQVKRPKPLRRGAMTKALKKATEQAAKQMAKDQTDITKHWSDPVIFKPKVTFKRDIILIESVPVSPRKKNLKIYNFIDRGTKAHIIRPRKKKALKFNTRHIAGSRPNSLFTSAGKSAAPVAIRKKVKHPGIKPRNWTSLLTKRWKKKINEYTIPAMTLVASESGHAIKRR